MFHQNFSLKNSFASSSVCSSPAKSNHNARSLSHNLIRRSLILDKSFDLSSFISHPSINSTTSVKIFPVWSWQFSCGSCIVVSDEMIWAHPPSTHTVLMTGLETGLRTGTEMSHLKCAGLTERGVCGVCVSGLTDWGTLCTTGGILTSFHGGGQSRGREGGRSPASRQYSCTHIQTHWQAGHYTGHHGTG